MPSRSTTRKAKQDLREEKSPTTAAGEFGRPMCRWALATISRAP
jgi:hypothetical protein